MARPNAGDDSNPRSGEGGPHRTAAQFAADPAFTGTYAKAFTAAGAWQASAATVPGELRSLPDGSQRVRIPGSPATTRSQWDATEATYWRGLSVNLAPYEFTPLTVIGHSWANGGPDIATGARLADRMNARCKATTFTNLGVGGKRMDEILSGQVQAAWTPNTLGWVLFVDGTINDSVLYGDTTGTGTTAEAFRTALSILSSKATVAASSASVQYGANASSASFSTGGVADIIVTGDTVDLQFTAATGSGGTFTVAAAGTTLATVTTGGYKQAFRLTKRISGLGSGNHTLRITCTVGSGSFVGASIPSASPPPIVWVQSAARNTGASSVALAASYVAACVPVAASFPNVITVAPDAFWDQARYVGPGFHPNDLGMAYLANITERAMAATVHQQGLNQVTGSTQDTTYSAPTPPVYLASGATAPAAPVLTATTASQVSLSWTVPVDNGSTITGYILESSPASAGTWTSVATVGATTTSYTVTTGLTATSSYDFRVRATNAVGTGPNSATSTTTAGVAVVTYFDDTFTRADSTSSLGSTETGSLTWTSVTGNTFQINNGDLCPNSAPNTNPADCYVDDGQADGTLTATVTTDATSYYGGLVFRATGTNNANGYIFYRDQSKQYHLKKRTSTSAYTALVDVPLGTVTAAAGDVIKVILNGSSITCYVNGILAASATDATYSGTRHGMFAPTNVGSGSFLRVTRMTHTSATS